MARFQFTVERSSPDTNYLKPANLDAEKWLAMIVRNAQTDPAESLIVEIIAAGLVGRTDRELDTSAIPTGGDDA